MSSPTASPVPSAHVDEKGHPQGVVESKHAHVATGPVTQPASRIEGGRPGWLTVFGAFWGLFATFGQLNSFGSFQVYYLQHQLANYSSSDISWIGSLQLSLFFISGAFVGRLFDMHGPRRLIICGTVIYTFSLMMTSICTQYYQFILAQGVLLSIGIALVFYPAVSATQTHFAKLRATASSIAVCGSSVGGIVFPIMLQALFPSVGFGWAVRIMGFVGFACCVVTCLCCTSRLPPGRAGRIFDLSAFKDSVYRTFSLGAVFTALGLFVPYIYIAQYAIIKLGSTPGHAFELLSLINAGSLVGRLVAGVVADYAGLFTTVIACNLLSGILCIALWLPARSYAAVACFAFFYGWFSGAFIALTPPCIAQISRLDQIGMRLGLLYAVMAIPCLASAPIGGAILSAQHGSYTGLIVWSGVTLSIGAICGGGAFVGVKLRARQSAATLPTSQ